MVFEAHKRCTELLTKHRDQVEKVAQRLLEREVLTRDDMVEMVGKRPHGDTYDEALSFGAAVPESAEGGHGIEGGHGGGLGNPVPEPKGIEGGPNA
jgi:AFG3 family protein